MVTLDSLDIKKNMEKARDNNLFTNDYASDPIITALSDKEWIYYWSINWRAKILPISACCSICLEMSWITVSYEKCRLQVSHESVINGHGTHSCTILEIVRWVRMPQLRTAGLKAASMKQFETPTFHFNPKLALTGCWTTQQQPS